MPIYTLLTVLVDFAFLLCWLFWLVVRKAWLQQQIGIQVEVEVVRYKVVMGKQNRFDIQVAVQGRS